MAGFDGYNSDDSRNDEINELFFQFKKSYPNFLTRDLNKVIDIIDCTGSGDIKMGIELELKDDGTLISSLGYPLKIRGGTGSPIRAVAVFNDN